ncbi:hypothetical protein COCMIDRAFT_5630 [Bipolaris oryzae ATCC 44560]|uniref:Uncharacterized protein n=1 Tax=Bipolaris oryzae ATCC 44560 TaxID=930090 RepID=W6ZCI1_COCMI|nr:uncharacterized protein COCMIDRAFT_5630 [Bipolaris oryzae ATCC 44560]EUC45139.1 hypothetical protein COCMIDRAFT_5630 [Bipolaris oryzae ATCC 44560]
MANVDIARSSAPVVASFELQSSLAHSHPLIVSHALSVAETCSLLLEIYDLAYKSLYHIHALSTMSRHSSTDLSPSNSSLQVNDCQRAPPQPDPEPAAPPVIILSNEQQQQQQQQQQNQAPPPLNPISPLSPVPTPRTPHTNTPSHSAMGSKVSKVRERAQDGKLQPSQEQLDKEQMKEPSNYYTHRSKSMRRKAGKGGDAGGSAAGASGTA